MGVIINIFKLPELRRRVLFTLGMLAVYRFGVFVAVPGVDRNVMAELVSQQTGGFLGYFNMFSGGALSNLSVFAPSRCVSETATNRNGCSVSVSCNATLSSDGMRHNW